MSDKVPHVIELMREARRDTVSNASLKRTVKACKALGIEGKDLWRVLAYLDIANPETGDPYSSRIERFW